MGERWPFAPPGWDIERYRTGSLTWSSDWNSAFGNDASEDDAAAPTL